MLGVLFSAILVSYFLDKTKNKFTLIKLSTLSVILALTKQMGILFVFIAGIIIFIDYCFIENKFSFKFVKNNLKYFLIPIISVVLFSILWKVSLIINHSTTSWNNPIKIIDFINILTGQAPAYRFEVIHNFVKAIFFTPLESLSCQFTLFMWSIFIIGCMIIIFKKDSKNSRQTLITYIMLFVGLIIYILVLLLSYMFKFSEWEAIRLASYARYLSSYILGMMIFLFAMFTQEHITDEKKFCKISSLLCVFCICFLNINALFEMTLGAKGSVNITVERRNEYKKYEKLFEDHITKNDKIYFIATNTNGGPYFIARYLSTPVVVQPPVWSFGKPYSDEDIFTVDITKEKWKEELLANNYTYVYLYHVDKEFQGLYGELFDQQTLKNNQLYKLKNSITGPILYLVK